MHTSLISVKFILQVYSEKCRAAAGADQNEMAMIACVRLAVGCSK